jgi:hypothetical protein
MLNAQFGLNTSFLRNGLYLALKLGYFNYSGIENLNFNSFNIGVLGTYRLLNERNLGLVRWRGLTLGSGLIYQKTHVDYFTKLEKRSGKITENYQGQSFNVDIAIDPSVEFGFDVSTMTIPLEINTAVRLLYIMNLGVGLGADLAFGTSRLDVDITGDIDAPVSGDASQYIHQTSPGSLSTSAGGTMSPTFLQPKLMFDLGFTLGPVVLDIPVTYYFLNKGISAGATVGVVF